MTDDLAHATDQLLADHQAGTWIPTPAEQTVIDELAHGALLARRVLAALTRARLDTGRLAELLTRWAALDPEEAITAKVQDLIVAVYVDAPAARSSPPCGRSPSPALSISPPGPQLFRSTAAPAGPGPASP
ncbi:hypothetical protein ACIRSU_13000 [Streptomyces sp. NPDC101160]|uniref:hypothetical protein n=1 Tax=Streptomyces sp. NPDC101160 TaxID=3366118 RepID=UPI003800E9F7